MAHALVTSSEPEVELESHAHMCVVGDNCLVIHDNKKPVMSTVIIQEMATEVQRQLMP